MAIQKKLWPPAPYIPWLTANARLRAKQEHGGGLDVGALRETAPRGVQILMPQVGWVPWTGSSDQWTVANMFSRIGQGWSYGPNSSSTHGDARGWYEDVEGKPADAMASVDLQYSREMFTRYRELYNAKHAAPVMEPLPKPTPTPTPTPVPVPTPAPAPVPASVGLRPLSSARTRVAELRAIVDSEAKFLVRIPEWLYSFVFFSPIEFQVEALRIYRLIRRSLGDTRPIPPEDLPRPPG